MAEFRIVPIFSTILYPSDLEISQKQTNQLLDITKNTEWYNPKDTNIRSKSLHIIKEYKLTWLKESIFNSFNKFKDNVLKYNNTKFVMTTSWLTCTKPGFGSTIHNHNNSMWSGVFYFGNEEGKSTGIEFADFANKMNGFVVTPTEYNDWNCSSYDYYPKNNSVIFFPSQTPHSVKKNKSKQNRYSIAFNLMPS